MLIFPCVGFRQGARFSPCLIVKQIRRKGVKRQLRGWFWVSTWPAASLGRHYADLSSPEQQYPPADHNV